MAAYRAQYGVALRCGWQDAQVRANGRDGTSDAGGSECGSGDAAARVRRRGDRRAALPLARAALARARAARRSRPARAATYKWVDEKGVVHYTDKMPPEAVDKGNVELNKQGVPIKKTEPAPTPEQRRAKAQEEERAEAAREGSRRRSRAATARCCRRTRARAEIDLARNRSLQTIDNVMQSSQAYSEQLTKRKAELEAKKKPSSPTSRCRRRSSASSRASTPSSRGRRT